MSSEPRHRALARRPIASAVRSSLFLGTLSTTLVFAPMTAQAIGFGASKVESALGQPLAVSIPINLSADENIAPDSLLAEIPDYWEQREQGVEPVGANAIEPEVVIKPDGQPEVRLRTEGPVSEPAVNFLLRLKWPGGALVSERSFLLDIAPSAGTAASTGPASDRRTDAARPQNAPLARSLSAGPASVNTSGATREYGPVQPGDTLFSVIRQFYPALLGQSTRVGQALVAANPGAFLNGDPSRLVAGATLRLPAPDTLFAGATGQTSAPSVAPAPTAPAAPAPAPAQVASTQTPDTRGWVDYGPVQAGQTLYGIAASIAGGAGGQSTRIPGIIRDIVAANPSAFVNGDANRMLSGVPIRVPAGADTASGARGITAAATTPAVASSTATSPAPTAASTATAQPAAPADPALVAERDELRQRIAETQAVIADELTRQASLEERISVLESRVGTLQVKITAQDLQIDQLYKDIDGVGGEIEAATASRTVTLLSDSSAASDASTPAAAGSTTSNQPANASQPAAAEREAKPAAKPKPRLQPPKPAPVETFNPMSPPVLGGAGIALLLLVGGYLWYRRRGPAAVKADDKRKKADTQARLEALKDKLADQLSAEELEDTGHNVVSIRRAQAGKLAEDAVAAYSAHDFETAEALVNQAIETDPSRDEYRELLACIMDATGREGDADKIRASQNSQAS